MTGVGVMSIKSYLTLSAAPRVDRQPDRSATRSPNDDPGGSYAPTDPAAHISAELRRVRLARRRGAHATARRHLEHLIDYVWFSDPNDGSDELA